MSDTEAESETPKEKRKRSEAQLAVLQRAREAAAEVRKAKKASNQKPPSEEPLKPEATPQTTSNKPSAELSVDPVEPEASPPKPPEQLKESASKIPEAVYLHNRWMYTI